MNMCTMWGICSPALVTVFDSGRLKELASFANRTGRPLIQLIEDKPALAEEDEPALENKPARKRRARKNEI